MGGSFRVYILLRWAPFSVLDIKYTDALFFRLNIISCEAPNNSQILSNFDRPATEGAIITRSSAYIR